MLNFFLLFKCENRTFCLLTSDHDVVGPLSHKILIEVTFITKAFEAVTNSAGLGNILCFFLQCQIAFLLLQAQRLHAGCFVFFKPHSKREEMTEMR